jgi:hypothetical protein
MEIFFGGNIDSNKLLKKNKAGGGQNNINTVCIFNHIDKLLIF